MRLFYFLQVNAPNGKIYINSPSTGRSWHTIHNPDGAGTTCDLRLHDVLLPTIYYGTTPNFPNYRLGALRGSACDTLGIEEGADYVCEPYVGTEESPASMNLGRMRVFPNPAHDMLNIEIPESNVSLQYKIYDVLGREQQIGILQNQISLKNLNNGIYYLSLYDENHLIYSSKLVVQQE